MIRVLAVDDDEEWRTLITQALPDYRVDTAASYPGAISLLRDGTPYDAAVVDLNLVNQTKFDQLGMRFLGHLRDNYPATPRIALTGTPPGAVGGLIVEYGLGELLLKQTMRLAELLKAVEQALKASDLPLELRAERGDRWDEFSEWRDSIQHRIDRKAKSPGNEPGLDTEAAITFESDTAGAAAMLANIRNQADLDAAVRECAALRERYRGLF
jgi:CheY-like chemotaxis protein